MSVIRVEITLLDIANEESVQGLVAITVKEFERVDYAMNAAGVSVSSSS